VIAPDDAQRGIVHQVIYDKLCLGVIQPASRQKYAEIMDDLVSQRAEAIILGCTEIGLLVGVDDCQVPIFDTTRIHAEAAVNLAIASE
jgi:aspartate racemase